MQHYYCPEWSVNSIIELSESESHHIKNVVRKKSGDKLYLVDGKGHQLSSEIVSFASKTAQVKIVEVLRKVDTPSLLHIAISPTKSNDRIEWFVEKACEIGVGKITPLICERTERRKVNLERWEKIALNACKQSKTLWFPEICEVEKFEKFIEENEDMMIASLSDDTKPIKEDIMKNTILVGPEGDFSEKELELAKKKKLEFITLGANVLRVETAGLVACTLWNEYQK